MSVPVPCSVLIADDVVALRRLVRDVLEATRRFEVLAEAENGVEAIEAAARHQPDLVLLDLSMPRMDGLEALPRIRFVAPDSCVIVLSGFGEGRIGERVLELGAAAYLEKGLDPFSLVDRIDAALARVHGNGQGRPSDGTGELGFA